MGWVGLGWVGGWVGWWVPVASTRFEEEEEEEEDLSLVGGWVDGWMDVNTLSCSAARV